MNKVPNYKVPNSEKSAAILHPSVLPAARKSPGKREQASRTDGGSEAF
jgi:hypothetical protein